MAKKKIRKNIGKAIAHVNATFAFARVLHMWCNTKPDIQQPA